MDNLKAILIFCVVSGHLLETCRGYGMNKLLYILVYSFHMPVFVFVSGYFASNRPKKLILNILWPYLLFQTLYILFMGRLSGEKIPLQYTKPYWLLWYLFAMAVWSLSLAALRRMPAGIRAAWMALAIAAALGAGFIDGIGREFSLSRILVFYPFFLAGYFGREPVGEKVYEWIKPYRKWLFAVCAAAVSAAVVYCCFHYRDMPVNWLYEAASYRAVKRPAFWRAVHLLTAGCWTVVFLSAVPDRYSRILSQIGRNTMSIYLMHGFVVKWMDRYQIMSLFKHQTLAVLALSSVVVLVFSSSIFVSFFQLLLPGKIPAAKSKDQQTGKAY